MDPVDGEKMRNMEAVAREIGNALKRALLVVPDTGFVLVLASYGEKPELTYISSINREDSVTMLTELLTRWKNGEADQTWSQRS
jgi:hypothetical protein